MLPVIQIGPLAVQASGLVLLLGLWLGLSLAERHSHQFGITPSYIYNLVLIALIAGVIGSRLSYALRYPEAFASSPSSLVSLNPALLDPLGGLAAGMIAALIYGQRKGLKMASTLDAVTPLLAVMAVAAGVAHLATGSAFGAPAKLPWSIQLWGEPRHPSQVYEILAASLILLVFWPGRKIYRRWQPGAYFTAFTGASALTYLFLQAFRGDSRLVFNSIRLNQVIAWVVLAACLIVFGKLTQQPKTDVSTAKTE